MKGEAKGGHRNQHRQTNERLWRETNEGRQGSRSQNGDHEGRQMKGDKAAAAAKSRPEWRSWRGTYEGRQAGSGSQQQARMAKSSLEWRSWRETMKGDKWRQERPRAGQNGDHEGRQMQGDKWKQEQPRAGQNGDHAGGQMKGDKWRQGQPRAGQNGDQEGGKASTEITPP